MTADDEPLPDDIYLHQGDTTEDENMYPQTQNPRSAVKSAPLSQQRSNINNSNMNNMTKSPAPLLSSTSNPRLRTSNTEPTFHDRDTDHNNDSNNVEGGTQIRSSLALLKAKVSKTAGRSRRISAGAAIGNLAQPTAGDGLDSESTSPLPSSSTAGHLSAPNSLGNTLENQLSSQRDNGMRHSQQVPPQQNRYSNQRHASQSRANAYGEADDNDEYADDFDHFSSNDYSSQQPGKSNALQRTQSSRSNSNNNKFQEENDFDDDVPPRSSAAAYLERLEQIAEQDGAAVYAGADTAAEDMGAEFAQENMEECPDCGRFFAPEPFSRHMKICKKVFLSKRKVFDSSKQRLDANPETLNKKKTGGRAAGATNKASAPPANNAPVSKWKEQSKQFREAMRAVRTGSTSGGDKNTDNNGNSSSSGNNAAPPQPYIDPTLIQCPNCQRRFNDKAAERHIPICKNIIAKPSSLKKGGGQTAGSLTATQTRTTGASNSGFGGNSGTGSGAGFNGARTTGARSGGAGWN